MQINFCIFLNIFNILQTSLYKPNTITQHKTIYSTNCGNTLQNIEWLILRIKVFDMHELSTDDESEYYKQLMNHRYNVTNTDEISIRIYLTKIQQQLNKELPDQPNFIQGGTNIQNPFEILQQQMQNIPELNR